MTEKCNRASMTEHMMVFPEQYTDTQHQKLQEHILVCSVCAAIVTEYRKVKKVLAAYQESEQNEEEPEFRIGPELRQALDEYKQGSDVRSLTLIGVREMVNQLTDQEFMAVYNVAPFDLNPTGIKGYDKSKVLFTEKDGTRMHESVLGMLDIIYTERFGNM